MAVTGRKSAKERKQAREARRVADAPPMPKPPKGKLVEIEGPAKVDVHDPDFGHVQGDHQGEVGEVESTYYNAERQEHMARVRVGHDAHGGSGQLRGIPVSRLKAIKEERPRERHRTSVSFSDISQDRWDAIFGKKDKK